MVHGLHVGDEFRSLSTKCRWIPPSTLRRDALTQGDKNDIVFRKVRGLLNKLTPEKFQKLSDDLLRVELNSSVILKGVIFLIFEKALDEPKYSSMYAQLCKRLSEEAPNFEGPDGPCTFRLLLLNKCRTLFEHRSEAFSDDINSTPEDEERRQIAKFKMLGNIRFIGELGKLDILSEGILHKCVRQLLDRRNRSKDMAEDLECLCQIMKTCGRILDTEKGQRLMEQYFDRIKKVLAKNVELPLRIRFMLRDVIELRNDGWVPRKANITEGPVPINQICEDDIGRSVIGGGGSGPGMDRGSGSNRREAFPHQEYFRRQLKTRGDLDDILSQGSFVPPPPSSHGHSHDKFNSFNTNGYQPGGGGGFRQTNRHNQQQQPQYYQQNRYNMNQHNNANNNSSNKDHLAPRFKRMLTAHQQGTNVEEISLRPATNSMLFKTQSKPQIMPRPSLLSEPLTAPLKPSPPIQTKDNSVVLIKQASMEKPKPNKKERGPTKEEILKKITTMTEDVLKSGNKEEGVSAFKEHRVPERLIPDALLTVLVYTLDKADTDRELAVSLISALRKEGLVTNSQFCDCYRNLVNGMADRETTIPKVYSHVAAFGSQAVNDGLLSLSDVAEMVDGGNHYPLFMLTLQNLHKSLGKVELTQLFNASKVNLLNTLPEADRTKDRLSEILEDRNLTFLFPLLRIQSELWKQVQADPNPAQLYKWVKENLDPTHHTDPGFVNALVTVLIKYITQEVGISEGKVMQDKEKALLEKFKTVLHPFLVDVDLQVTAVYALQVYCYTLDFPKGMLLRWFLNLYDLEIVEEEAFLKWREDVTDSYPGKGKALFQVNTWLTWLAEAESEEEEEGDS